GQRGSRSCEAGGRRRQARHPLPGGGDPRAKEPQGTLRRRGCESATPDGLVGTSTAIWNDNIVGAGTVRGNTRFVNGGLWKPPQRKPKVGSLKSRLRICPS